MGDEWLCAPGGGAYCGFSPPPAGGAAAAAAAACFCCAASASRSASSNDCVELLCDVDTLL